MKLEVLKKDNYYHIYNRGINSENIFKNEENKRYFLKLFSKYLKEKVSVISYCLLDNHYHFLIKVLEEPKIVTQSFSNFFNAYAKAYNKQQNRTGSLFEKHFKRKRTTDEKYLKNLILYIHKNPENHQLTDKFYDYKFSSYQDIINNNSSFIEVDQAISYFDDLENFKYSHQRFEPRGFYNLLQGVENFVDLKKDNKDTYKNTKTFQDKKISKTLKDTNLSLKKDNKDTYKVTKTLQDKKISKTLQDTNLSLKKDNKDTYKDTKTLQDKKISKTLQDKNLSLKKDNKDTYKDTKTLQDKKISKTLKDTNLSLKKDNKDTYKVTKTLQDKKINKTLQDTNLSLKKDNKDTYKVTKTLQDKKISKTLKDTNLSLKKDNKDTYKVTKTLQDKKISKTLQNNNISFKELFFTYIENLQDTITSKLEKVDGKVKFREDLWKRAEGGGGRTRVIENGNVFEKGGVNISKVYGELPEVLRNQFGVEHGNFFACGLSLVIHPKNPFVPTVHANWRYFEMYDDSGNIVTQWFGGGQDLTPYYLFEEDATHFHQVCKNACDRHNKDFYSKYKINCDNYFWNAHRNEARGIGGLFFDYLKENEEMSMQNWYNFVTEVGNSFLTSYVPIVEKRKYLEYTQKHKNWQEIRRGRYVEFNLVHDRGTLFGLKTNGRIESILMSLPPTVQWKYNHQPKKNTKEYKLVEVLKNPKNWV